MAQESLLQMLEELASKVRSLEREKKEAVARAQALEREVVELAAVIAQASAKVDEMLKEGTTTDMSRPGTVSPPATSTPRDQLGEFSADPRRGLK